MFVPAFSATVMVLVWTVVQLLLSVPVKATVLAVPFTVTVALRPASPSMYLTVNV